MKYSELKKSERDALQVYVKLMRAANRTTNDVHRHLQEDNLTHSQFAVIEALYHLGPLSQGELGQKILKSNANLTTVVDSLEKKKLVERKRSAEDRRRVEVFLTEAGAELIARVFPRHAEIVARELSILTAEEQIQLAFLLRKFGRRD